MKRKKQRRCANREKHPVRRTHKDRLFRLVFQDKKDLLSLYNAVNGTDYQNPEDLVITTLEDAEFQKTFRGLWNRDLEVTEGKGMGYNESNGAD